MKTTFSKTVRSLHPVRLNYKWTRSASAYMKVWNLYVQPGGTLELLKQIWIQRRSSRDFNPLLTARSFMTQPCTLGDPHLWRMWRRKTWRGWWRIRCGYQKISAKNQRSRNRAAAHTHFCFSPFLNHIMWRPELLKLQHKSLVLLLVQKLKCCCQEGKT